MFWRKCHIRAVRNGKLITQVRVAHPARPLGLTSDPARTSRIIVSLALTTSSLRRRTKRWDSSRSQFPVSLAFASRKAFIQSQTERLKYRRGSKYQTRQCKWVIGSDDRGCCGEEGTSSRGSRRSCQARLCGSPRDPFGRRLYPSLALESAADGSGKRQDVGRVSAYELGCVEKEYQRSDQQGEYCLVLHPARTTCHTVWSWLDNDAYCARSIHPTSSTLYPSSLARTLFAVKASLRAPSCVRKRPHCLSHRSLPLWLPLSTPSSHRWASWCWSA